MPYIKSDKRKALLGRAPIDAGELNYVVTRLIRAYFARKGGNYQAANDIEGALQLSLDEFRRRILHPYEDKKLKENGDVEE